MQRNVMPCIGVSVNTYVEILFVYSFILMLCYILHASDQITYSMYALCINLTCFKCSFLSMTVYRHFCVSNVNIMEMLTNSI